MKSLWIGLLFFTLWAPAGLMASSESTVILPAGTEVRLEMRGQLSSAQARENQRVFLDVVEDVVLDGRVVITRGSTASGTVTRAQRRRGFGRNGRLDFTIDAVKAVDGRNIRLRTNRSHRGKDRYVKAGVVTLITGPFGALVKGKDIEIPTGTEYVLYIDPDQEIELPQTATR